MRSQGRVRQAQGTLRRRANAMTSASRAAGVHSRFGKGRVPTLQTQLEGDFASGHPGAVANDVSDDMSKAKGGDFGWVGQTAIPPRLAERVWAIEPGDMSEALRGDFAFALVQVTAARGQGPCPFEEKRDLATEQLRKSKIHAAVASLVAARRDAARVEGTTPEIAAALQR